MAQSNDGGSAGGGGGTGGAHVPSTVMPGWASDAMNSVMRGTSSMISSVTQDYLSGKIASDQFSKAAAKEIKAAYLSSAVISQIATGEIDHFITQWRDSDAKVVRMTGSTPFNFATGLASALNEVARIHGPSGTSTAERSMATLVSNLDFGDPKTIMKNLGNVFADTILAAPDVLTQLRDTMVRSNEISRDYGSIVLQKTLISGIDAALQFSPKTIISEMSSTHRTAEIMSNAQNFSIEKTLVNLGVLTANSFLQSASIINGLADGLKGTLQNLEIINHGHGFKSAATIDRALVNAISSFQSVTSSTYKYLTNSSWSDIFRDTNTFTNALTTASAVGSAASFFMGLGAIALDTLKVGGQLADDLKGVLQLSVDIRAGRGFKFNDATDKAAIVLLTSLRQDDPVTVLTSFGDFMKAAVINSPSLIDDYFGVLNKLGQMSRPGRSRFENIVSELTGPAIALAGSAAVVGLKSLVKKIQSGKSANNGINGTPGSSPGGGAGSGNKSSAPKSGNPSGGRGGGGTGGSGGNGPNLNGDPAARGNIGPTSQYVQPESAGQYPDISDNTDTLKELQEISDEPRVSGGVQDAIASVANDIVGGAWGTYFEEVRSQARADDDEWEERRIVDDAAENCLPCLGLQSMSWVPIGTLPAINEETPCGFKQRCRCKFEFRRIGASGPEESGDTESSSPAGPDGSPKDDPDNNGGPKAVAPAPAATPEESPNEEGPPQVYMPVVEAASQNVSASAVSQASSAAAANAAVEAIATSAVSTHVYMPIETAEAISVQLDNVARMPIQARSDSIISGAETALSGEKAGARYVANTYNAFGEGQTGEIVKGVQIFSEGQSGEAAASGYNAFTGVETGEVVRGASVFGGNQTGATVAQQGILEGDKSGQTSRGSEVLGGLHTAGLVSQTQYNAFAGNQTGQSVSGTDVFGENQSGSSVPIASVSSQADVLSGNNTGAVAIGTPIFNAGQTGQSVAQEHTVSDVFGSGQTGESVNVYSTAHSSPDAIADPVVAQNTYSVEFRSPDAVADSIHENQSASQVASDQHYNVLAGASTSENTTSNSTAASVSIFSQGQSGQATVGSIDEESTSNSGTTFQSPDAHSSENIVTANSGTIVQSPDAKSGEMAERGFDWGYLLYGQSQYDTSDRVEYEALDTHADRSLGQTLEAMGTAFLDTFGVFGNSTTAANTLNEYDHYMRPISQERLDLAMRNMSNHDASNSLEIAAKNLSTVFQDESGTLLKQVAKSYKYVAQQQANPGTD